MTDKDITDMNRIFNDLELHTGPHDLPRMEMDGNSCYLHVEPDFERIYEAFRRTHAKHKHGYHHAMLQLTASKSKISKFLQALHKGEEVKLVWGRWADTTNHMTLKEFLGKMSHYNDMSVFDFK